MEMKEKQNATCSRCWENKVLNLENAYNNIENKVVFCSDVQVYYFKTQYFCPLWQNISSLRSPLTNESYVHGLLCYQWVDQPSIQNYSSLWMNH